MTYEMSYKNSPDISSPTVHHLTFQVDASNTCMPLAERRLLVRKVRILAISSLITIPCLAVAFSINTNHKHQQTVAGTNGAETPHLIPDHAAQEAFLRSLTAEPNDERGQERARLFAEQAAEGSGADALLVAAQNFVRQTKPLDEQVREIKDQHWPQPNDKVMAQLAKLQQQKEKILDDVLSSVSSRLAEDNKDKLSNHISDYVKRRMVSLKTPPPTQHQGHGVGMVLGMIWGFNVPSPVQTMDEGYTYTNQAINFIQLMVYGYGGTAESYSSWGDRYRITTTTSLGGYSESETYPSSGHSPAPFSVSTFFNMFRNAEYLDGLARSRTVGEIVCPFAAGAIFSMGSSSSEATIVSYLILGQPGNFNPPSVSVGGAISTLLVRIAASKNASTDLTGDLEIGYSPNSGDADIAMKGGGTVKGFGSGETKTYECTYDPTVLRTTTAEINGVAVLTGGGLPGQQRQNSIGTLRINP